MASGSAPQSTPHSAQESNVGDSEANLTVVEVIPTNRNPKIWCNYDLCVMSNGKRKARCKKCGGWFKEEGNTTLKNHMNLRCKVVKFGPMSDQTQLGVDGNIWQYDAMECRDRMAKFVIQEALPFDHFDNPRLTKLIQDTLQPRYRNVSRTTLRRDCIEMWKLAKYEMVKGFECLQTSVNLTTDVWTAPNGSPDSFICVTAHWVNPNTWEMMNRTITFELFGYPHTGERLYQILDRTIKTYKLEGKIFSISFDNASNNTAAVGRLKLKYKPACDGVFFHSRCVAHIINLVVQDGLKTIEPIKDAFKQMLKDIFSSSNARYHKYMKFCTDANALFLGPNWETPTRWNSTCNMMECGLRQKDTLKMFHDLLSERNRVTPYPESSWETLKLVTEMLHVFKTATTLLSGIYYPTSCLVLNQIFLMSSKINDFEVRGGIFEDVVKPMKAKLLKYFKEMPPVITCSAALNPTLNVAGVEVLLQNIAYDLGLLDEDPEFASKSISTFNSCFQSLFQVYLQKYGTTSNIHDMMQNSGASGSVVRERSETIRLYNTLRNENTKRARSTTPSSELGRYMGSDFLSQMSVEDFENFNMMAWWKGRESQFPILAAMARDLLTVQASTVASESCFSLSGRVMSPRRTKLTPLSLEVCVCLKSHLDGMERIQHISPLEGELKDVEKEVHEEEIAMGLSVPLTIEELQFETQLHNNYENDDE